MNVLKRSIIAAMVLLLGLAGAVAAQSVYRLSEKEMKSSTPSNAVRRERRSHPATSRIVPSVRQCLDEPTRRAVASTSHDPTGSLRCAVPLTSANLRQPHAHHC